MRITIILAAALVVAATVSANAQTFVQRCSWSHGSYTCIYSDGSGAAPRIIHVPQYDEDEPVSEQERLARRERTCRSPSVVCLEASK